jgi:colanic acid biosynthesis glycosyl transferase WcaI
MVIGKRGVSMDATFGREDGRIGRPASDRGLDVLVVNQYYPPDGAATAAVFGGLVEALEARGHRVTVLCGRPSYGIRKRLPWRPLGRERAAEVAVERVGSTAFDRRRISGRIANYVSYLVLAGLRALIRPRPDVVVVGSDPPLAILVALVAARGAPIVYSLRDLHPDTALAAGRIRPVWTTRLWDRLHVAAARRAAVVVCLGDAMRVRVTEKGVPEERVVVVPDGAPEPSGLPDPAVVAELGDGARFVAVHAGNLGVAGAWETLAMASRLLDEGTRLVFVGEGCRATDTWAMDLHILPFRPVDELPSVMAAGDVQVVTLRPGMEGLVVPSKVYTALAHGRPVLAVVPEGSEVSAIVRRWRCGVVADPGDPWDVARKLAWCREHPEELLRMADRARAAGRSYERRACLARLVQVIESAAAKVAALEEGVSAAA